MRKRVDRYLTEFGVQSEPDPVSGVSETRQAEYRSIGELIAYRNSRVRAFSQYCCATTSRARTRGTSATAASSRDCGIRTVRSSSLMTAFGCRWWPNAVGARGCGASCVPPLGAPQCGSGTATAARRAGAPSSATAPTRARIDGAPGQPDLHAVALVLIESISAYHSLRRTFGRAPDDVDDERFIAGWVETALAVAHRLGLN